MLSFLTLVYAAWLGVAASGVATPDAVSPTDFTIAYPGHEGEWVRVQGMLELPDGGGQRHHLSVGITQGHVTETFERTWHDARSPIVFEVLLPPGHYDLDLDFDDGAWRWQGPFEVPAPARLPRFETDGPLAEANRALAPGASRLVLMFDERDSVRPGMRVAEARISGRDIAKVRFLLDGRQLVELRRAPWLVHLEGDSRPRPQLLRAEAYDIAGVLLAVDEMVIDGGRHRFDLELVSPRNGTDVASSLRIDAEIRVPAGDEVTRFDVFLDDVLAVEIAGPPWSLPLVVAEPPQFVRVAAELASGRRREAVAVVNAEGAVDAVEIDLVELYTTVTDSDGRLITDLDAGAVTVREDDVEQEIRRFERVEDLPIWATMLIDVSASMSRDDRLATAQVAMSDFAHRVISPRDRLAIVAFNERPSPVLDFTADPIAIDHAIDRLSPRGGTSLWDSLIVALHDFDGIEEQRVALLITDGEDELSRASFADARATARRAGVALYAIGLDLPRGEPRNQLEELAAETGGRVVFVDDADELAAAWATLERELRSRYLIVYQSSNTGRRFRTVEVDVARPGASAATIRGYDP
ncbi:MAG: VWA domain-containing protein [Acidobacteriota bacterium]